MVGTLHVDAFEGAAVDRQHLVLARFGIPAADHFDQLVAMLNSQVVGFGIVLVDVVQLPVVRIDIDEHLVINRAAESPALFGGLGEARPRPRADRPPAVVVDGTVTEHLEVLGVVVAGCGLIVESVGEAHPVDRRLAHAADALRRFNAQRFQDRRDEIDDVRILRAHLATRLDALGPRDDARVGGAAPVRLALPAAEGRIAGVGPAPRVVVVRTRRRPAYPAS